MVVDASALFGGTQRGVTNDAPEFRKGCRDGALRVSSGRSFVGREVADRLSTNTLGGQVKHQGGLQLSTSLEVAFPFEEIRHVDRHQVYYGDRCERGEGGEECFKMGFEPLAGDDDYLPHAVVVPFGQYFVYRPMEGLAAWRARSGESVGIGSGDTEVECGCQEEVQSGRQLRRHALCDQRSCTKGEVGPEVVECPHGPNQPWVAGKDLPDAVRGKVTKRI